MPEGQANARFAVLADQVAQLKRVQEKVRAGRETCIQFECSSMDRDRGGALQIDIKGTCKTVNKYPRPVHNVAAFSAQMTYCSLLLDVVYQ